MDAWIDLLKEHQVGKWCKRAAWIVAALGLSQIVFQIYSDVLRYSSNGNSLPGTFIPVVIAGDLRFSLSIISTTIFFFFILYAAGVIVNQFVADTAEEDETDEEEEESDTVVEEEDEKVMPGQIQ